ncbi:MAG: GAF domain-containing sensor histidine kinase [Chloroflexi bacterium]|nr:GAF domain-containing sensor histidine kinase [Chloroflexota bacterium]
MEVAKSSQVNQFESRGAETLDSERLKRLLEISARLSSTLRLSELLDLVMDVSTELTNTEVASILLVDRKSGQLYFVASTSGSVPTNIAVPLDDSIAGWVVRNGRSVVIDDVKGDDRHYNIDKDLAFDTRSMLAVPLVTRQGIIGALEVMNKRKREPYTMQDVSLMEALASQSAVAIVNAHLFSQSDLLAEIMHEIKTPLMAITSATELLSRPEVPQERHGQLIDMIKRESQRLSKMTRDFLDFARLESGRVDLKKDPLELEQVVEDVVSISQPQAAERDITIEVDYAADLPHKTDAVTLVGDQDRVKQVLLNLVSNATKYNRENGRLSITVRRVNDEAHILVADTGPGIAPEDVPHLFERFYRIPGSNRAEGTGLGLSVSKKIVEEHHGRIEVHSVLGEGTTFTVCLPLTQIT